MSLGGGDNGTTRRANNFGSVRLVFAALVVVAHAPELIDGNRSREPLTRLFGTLSFGELAVDGFFLVSGYLIVASFLRARSVGDFLWRRILRIYPAFIIASLVCLLVVAPLAGGNLTEVKPLRALGRMLSLSVPEVPGAFAGLPNPALNGAMWSIAYEFRCYLLVLILGCLGVLRHRGAYLAVLTAFAALFVARTDLPSLTILKSLIGYPPEAIRLTFAFLCGGAFHVFSDWIRLDRRGAAIAALLLGPAMTVPALAEPALIVLGGYLTFWFACVVRPNPLSLATNETDPSYGLYLYAWPVQNLLVAGFPDLSPIVGGLATLVAAGLLGLVSWHLIEKPALGWR
ncbi:acyltransferase [Methylobacterium sp. BTF04]|uniref:acyltransferase family protein n=1 Tax=Methylobacterium sp. BTF04 TaxID=2708300 RepID=UPI0013D8000F|nr:acyltransferase [Methylobacterium sp. BTF04]NEU11431.1 acyltransferase [Methylobacterium sp. BTF04]